MSEVNKNNVPQLSSLDNIELYILNSIKNGIFNQRETAKLYNVSESYISQKCKKLEKMGLIVKEVRTSCNIWKINPNVNLTEMLAIYDTPLKNNEFIVKSHNYRIKYKVLKDNKEIHFDSKPNTIRNWVPEYGTFSEVSFQRTPNHIVFWLKEPVILKCKRAEEIESAKLIAMRTIEEGAKKFQEKFGITLDLAHPEVVRKEIKIKNEKLNSIANKIVGNIYNDVMKKVYANGEIEYVDEIFAKQTLANLALEDKSEKIMEEVKDLREAINSLLIPALKEQAESNRKLAENLSLHYSVLQEMRECLREMKGRSMLKEFGGKLKRFFTNLNKRLSLNISKINIIRRNEDEAKT